MYQCVKHSCTALSFSGSSPGYSMHTQEGNAHLNESNEKVILQKCDDDIPKRSCSTTHCGHLHPCTASQWISLVYSLVGETRRQGVTQIVRIASSPVSITKAKWSSWLSGCARQTIPQQIPSLLCWVCANDNYPSCDSKNTLFISHSWLWCHVYSRHSEHQ